MKKHATRGPVWNGLKLHLQLRKPDKNMAHRNQTLHCHLIKQILRTGDRCHDYCALCPYTNIDRRRFAWWAGDTCYRGKYTVVK